MVIFHWKQAIKDKAVCLYTAVNDLDAVYTYIHNILKFQNRQTNTHYKVRSKTKKKTLACQKYQIEQSGLLREVQITGMKYITKY